MPAPRSVLRSFFIILFACVSVQAFAAPEKGWPQDDSDLVPDARLTFGTLDNGLRYIVMPNKRPEGEASLRLYVDVGSLMEQDPEQGFAHYIEHMAFNGTRNMPEGDFVKTIQRLGFAFGADANAFTSFDQTVYQLDLPNLKAETVDTAFMLMREVAGNVLFEEGAVERERGVVLSEYRLNQSVATESSKASDAFVAPDARFGHRYPIGTEATLKAATAEGLKAFYEAFYRPERALVVMVGDMAADDMAARIKATFSDWQAAAPARDLAYMDESPLTPISEPALKLFSAEGLGNNITISRLSAPEDEPDTKAGRIKAFQRKLAARIVNRRLDIKRTDAGSGLLGTSVGYYSLYGVADGTYLSAGMEPDRWQDVLAALTEEYNRAYEHGFTDAEMQEVLANFDLSARHAIDTADKTTSATWANRLVRDFNESWVSFDAEAELALEHEAADGLTPEKLRDIFRADWNLAAPHIYVTAGEGFDVPEAKLLAAYETLAAKPASAPEVKEKTEFAYTDFGTPGTIKSRTEILDGRATEIRFDNNVMLTLMPTDFENASIYASLRFGDGLVALTPENGALRYLIDAGYAAGGLEAHDRNALVKMLAGKTVRVGGGTTDLAFEFGGGFRPEDMLFQMQIWAAYLMKPGFRDEAVGWFRRGLASYYEQITSTAGSMAGAYGMDTLIYGQDYRFVLPPLEMLQSLDMDGVRAVMDDQRLHGAIELTLVGDFDPEAAIAAVAQTLGALPKRAERAHRFGDLKVKHLPPASKTLYHKGPADQAYLALSWPTDDTWDIKRAATLALLAEVLQTRLRDQVREAMGASYGPGVHNAASSTVEGLGTFLISTDARPADIDKLYDTILDLTQNFAPVTEDEVTEAREPQLAGFQTAQTQNGYWMRRLKIAQSNPERVAYDDQFMAALQALIPADLDAAAKTWLDKAKMSVVKALPETVRAGAADQSAAGK